MTQTLLASTLDLVRDAAHPLTGASHDYDPLLDLAGDAQFVLIGEASHGTHEFYRERAIITRRLIVERGFNAVAVEADWPDAYRVNRYVRGDDSAADAEAALSGFRRFPTWMWRNAEVLDFVGWLRTYNDARAERARVGFYGLDLYSLFTSMTVVLDYLDKLDPEAARHARFRYACFDQVGEDPQAYGWAASMDLSASCEDEVVSQLVELRRRASEYVRRDGRLAADEYFAAEQNARLVANAERYYRTMFRGRVSSWNLRDRHMADTLSALAQHFEAQGTPVRVVLWAHNSHLGDARATEMGWGGELNVGQLVRETYGASAVLIGSLTHTGTVTAASDWDAMAERKRVRPSLEGSYERLFHDTGLPRFLLTLRDSGDVADALHDKRLERAIGVIYAPETERMSHYFHARLPSQFDAVLHFDDTRAVEPLEPSARWTSGEPPETYPTGQ
jgi:erythromycin esterase-like protein